MMRASKSTGHYSHPPPYSPRSGSTGCASRLAHHTWTVHAVSPLTYFSLRPTYLESMLDDDLCFGGDYCHLTWFTLDHDDDGEEIDSLHDAVDNVEDDVYEERSYRTPSSKKRKGRQPPSAAGGSRYRALRTDHEILFGPYSNLQLIIDLYSNDERLLCSVAFCFVELSRGRVGSLGNMALVRGTPSAVEAVWQWMELKTGCRISRNPTRPTSALIAASVALWTVQSTTMPATQASRSSKASNNGLVSLCSSASSPYGSSSGSAVSSPVRPLVLTWTPPPDCQKRGIDTCSTVVAPAGLLRLCHDLRALQIWKDGLPLFVGDGAKMAAAASAKGSQRLIQSLFSLSSSNKPDPCQASSHTADPLLATIVNFVSAELGLQLHRFSLSHATCSVACLGSDGQCKPLSDAHMLQCMQVLRSVVGTLYPAAPKDAFPTGSVSVKQRSSSSVPAKKMRAQDANDFGHGGGAD